MVLDRAVDFETWDCRNLARVVLGRIYENVITRFHKNNEEHKHSPPLTVPMRKRPRPESSRRFDRRYSRSSSMGTCAEERGLVFLPRQTRTPDSLRSFACESIECFSEDSESTVSLNIDQPRMTFLPAVPYYRRFSRSSSRADHGFVWMTSGQFTTQAGKRKIIEYIHKHWTLDAPTKFLVNHICAIPLPGIVRHKYATIWQTAFTSRIIYFSLDVSTVYIRRPISVTFTFPNGRRQHRPNTSRRHFENFMRGLYPYGQG
ncbi:hypothetical protein Y032_0011g1309 [Ancylostoma ceylanicum]|uniref:Uncharacterized protein n=1 Tax=Ancylostoma ceylanicum TaxID=53326 RepID=A0A016VDC4_9BILA|nr:hypothetical protein Y032_0011g1309 [Ancylostoma ceylanicum]